jgi:methyl-accepting chemotaxis protein
MRGILTGRPGLAPTLLVVIIVWALAAVLMLTGTLVAARSIDRDVKIITPEYNDIGTNAHAIALTTQTAHVSGQIRVAAKPLSGELAQTLIAARGIDSVARSILGRAGSINGVVRSINASVSTIHGTVGAIGSNISDVEANARAINASARSIRASALSINASARSISSSVASIRSRGGGILSTVHSIDRRVAGDNALARQIRDGAGPIADDLHAVLPLVPLINARANAIDCSRLINSVGSTSGCRR